ncbi:MAG: anti-sigma factor RsbW [Thermoleophilia bacterium]|nr:anti-sigma factor RsbW [Thermoleophilia bacterium]
MPTGAQTDPVCRSHGAAWNQESVVRSVMTTTEAVATEQVRLEIPPKPQFVSLCRLALTAICREHRFSDDDIADLKLAITEACSNSIRHAYVDDEHDASKVYVSYEMQDDRLVVIVRDEGCGFEYEGANTDDLPEGGLGISIIRAVCDEFEVLTGAGETGAALRLVKVRSVAENAA